MHDPCRRIIKKRKKYEKIFPHDNYEKKKKKKRKRKRKKIKKKKKGK